MTALSLCFIGNSHLAAIKTAWDEHESEYPQFRLRFFGAPGMMGARLPDMEFTDGKAIVRDPEIAKVVKIVSGGEDSIVFDKHDAFVMTGLGLGIRRVLLLLGTHLPTEEYQSMRLDQELITDACFLQSIKDLLNNSPLILLLKKLRAHTDKPIYVYTEPYLSENARKHGKFKHIPPNEALERSHKLYSRCLKAIVAEAGGVLISQPKATIRRPCFTRRRFSRGATSVFSGGRTYSKQDVRHMNKSYGALLLASLAKRIAADASSTAGPEIA